MNFKIVIASVAIAVGSVLAGAAAHAGVVYSNDFSTTATDFTGGAITTAPSGENFLSFGGAGGSATLTLTGLASHASVQLSFSLYVIGSMDGNGPVINGGGSGDFFTVNYSGSGSGNAFNQTFANYGGGNTQSYPNQGSAPDTGAASINALGYSGFPATDNVQDSEYLISLSAINDSSSTFSFQFIDNSNEGMANEFYGIDNVVVSINGTPSTNVPEPASIFALLSGLVGLMLWRRRRSV